MKHVPTASQTVGPYFHLGLTHDRGALSQLVPDNVKGERIRLVCTVLDGDGVPVPDAMIEIWQANADGKYNHPDDMQKLDLEPRFLGFGRVGSDETGTCVFDTIKPGAVIGSQGVAQAPHINVSVFARGVLKRLATRVYFAGDPQNASDPVLALIPEDRRATLLAISNAPGIWDFKVRLSGADETVFFDI